MRALFIQISSTLASSMNKGDLDLTNVGDYKIPSQILQLPDVTN